MPAPRNFEGRWREGGPGTLYALLQRDDDTTDWVPGDVVSFLVEIFDTDAVASFGTPVWSKNYASPSAYLLSRVDGVGAAPSGYNFKLQFGHDEADDSAVRFDAITLGGHKLSVEVTYTSSLPDVDGVTVIWDVTIEPRRRT